MAKRSGDTSDSSDATEPVSTPGRRITVTERERHRIDQLMTVVDQCSAAKAIADHVGHKFLAYLLSMAIQEARSGMIEHRSQPPR
jgi:hypothetical protein